MSWPATCKPLSKQFLTIYRIKMTGQTKRFYNHISIITHHFINWTEIFSGLSPFENRIKTSTTEGVIVAAITKYPLIASLKTSPKKVYKTWVQYCITSLKKSHISSY